MTAIYIECYKDSEVFVFSDSRTTAGTIIHSEKSEKVHRLPDGNIMAICGLAGMYENILELYMSSAINLESVAQLSGSGAFYIVDKHMTTEVNYNNEKDNKSEDNHIIRFKNTTLPLSAGSGGPGVLMSALALDVKNKKTRAAYIKAVQKAFSVNASIDTSCNSILQFESIKL